MGPGDYHRPNSTHRIADALADDREPGSFLLARFEDIPLALTSSSFQQETADESEQHPAHELGDGNEDH